MRKYLEIGLCFITSALSSIWIMLYVFKEDEIIRFIFGEFLIALGIFMILMWLFEIAKVRERRKQNEIRKTNSRRD